MLSAAELVAEFGVYINQADSLDAQRALVVLDLAIQRCRSVVTPVPDDAKPIVLEAAKRAYPNPTGVTSEQTGPFQRTFSTPGVYLTRLERADLLRIAGGGGAFTVNTIAHLAEEGS